MREKSMTNSWLFPPNTRELQLDEKWSFVQKKEKNCAPDPPGEPTCGDNWDHIAYDPEHRLVLAVVNGKRSHLHVRAALAKVKRIMGGRVPRLVLTDEYRAYKEELLYVFGVKIPVPRLSSRGRPPAPRLEPPPGLVYATVHKTRRNGKVVKVEPRLHFGTPEELAAALRASKVNRRVNTAFIERQNGTDRHRNSRKARKTYRFSKDWDRHNAMTCFSLYSYNFCWCVRTLREQDESGRFHSRTPAMAAGSTDHVWSLWEWLSFPTSTDKF